MCAASLALQLYLSWTNSNTAFLALPANVTVLRPQQEPAGWSNVADLGPHVVTPLLLVVG